MADDTIKYTVEFDEQDIAQKLSGLRAQLDSVMGDYFTNLSTSNAPPLSYASDQAPLSAPSIMPPLSPATTSANFYDTFVKFANESKSAVQQGMARLDADVSSALGNFSRNIPSLSTSTSFSNVLGFSGGFDERMPFFEVDLKREARKRFSDSIDDAMTPFLDVGFDVGTAAASGRLAGMAASGLGGPAAIAVGATLFASDLLAGPTIRRQHAIEQMGEAFQELGDYKFLMTQNQGRNVARNVVSFLDRPGSRLQDYTLEEITNNLQSFAEGGGFSGVGSAEELEQKAINVVEQVRQVSKTWNMAQEAVATALGEMESKGIMDVGQAGMFASTLTSRANSVGLAAGPLMQLGLQGAEQVRGTGLGAQFGFNSMIDARVEAQRLENSADPYIRNLMFDQGGVSGVANQIFSGDIAYLGSNLGRLQGMQLMQGGSPYGNIYDLITGASDIASGGIANMLRAQGRADYYAQQVDPNLARIKGVANMMDLIPGLGAGKDGYDTDIAAALMVQLEPTVNSLSAARINIERFDNLRESLQTMNDQGNRFTGDEMSAILRMGRDTRKLGHSTMWDDIVFGAESMWDASFYTPGPLQLGGVNPLYALRELGIGKHNLIDAVGDSITGFFEGIGDLWNKETRVRGLDTDRIYSPGQIELLQNLETVEAERFKDWKSIGPNGSKTFGDYVETRQEEIIESTSIGGGLSSIYKASQEALADKVGELKKSSWSSGGRTPAAISLFNRAADILSGYQMDDEERLADGEPLVSRDEQYKENVKRSTDKNLTEAQRNEAKAKAIAYETYEKNDATGQRKFLTVAQDYSVLRKPVEKFVTQLFEEADIDEKLVGQFITAQTGETLKAFLEGKDTIFEKGNLTPEMKERFIEQYKKSDRTRYAAEHADEMATILAMSPMNRVTALRELDASDEYIKQLNVFDDTAVGQQRITNTILRDLKLVLQASGNSGFSKNTYDQLLIEQSTPTEIEE